jgi:CRISPR-associated protein Cas1
VGDIQQNTLYLTTPGTYVARDHLTLQLEIPLYPADLPPEEQTRDRACGFRKVAIPIHHLESICAFGFSVITPGAMELCWEHGVALNYLSSSGRFQARMTGVADTSVMLRRGQFRAADDPVRCADISRQIITGKIQNARNSLLRASRESTNGAGAELGRAIDALAGHVRFLSNADEGSIELDALRGTEGLAANVYFSVFSEALKQQRSDFEFKVRTRRPPRDRINCLLSFLYALLLHDCVSGLASVGLDPFVGFLHADRPNRPSLGLDLMEEFRPWLADRLAITVINRQQITASDFVQREGGAVEFTDAGRRATIKAYQERKQDRLTHPLLDQSFMIAQMPFVQARILARHLRGDLPKYLPLIPK